MSTASVPPPQNSPDTLSDWARHFPHRVGYVRAILFAIGLGAAGLLGMWWANPAPPEVYDKDEQCTYAAARFDPPANSMTAVVSMTFQITWKIQNTGSCHSWGDNVLFVRRNNDIPSQATSYSAPSTPLFSAQDNFNPVNGAQVTTIMTAPTASGTYVTEWTMVAPNGTRFGPIMRQRVQVTDLNSVPPPPIPNEPPHSLLIDLASIVYHLLPALLGIFFVLWRASAFLIKAFHLPASTSGMPHVMGLMFGSMPFVLSVQNGKLVSEDSDKAAQIIGGPAWLYVAEASAVLLERNGGFSRIVGTGVYRLRPHERVRGTVDLRTQHRIVPANLLTKDGIPVKMDVDLVFRVSEKDMPIDPPSSPPPPLGPIERIRQRVGLRVQHDKLETVRPHRFSREAIRRIVYETAIAAPGQPPDWTMSFANVRSGDITDQIAVRRLDEISAPEDTQAHPRAEVARKGVEVARGVASTQGIELLEMTLGVIEPQDKYRRITEQVIYNWKIEWERRAKILTAQAEAKRTQLLEEARAEAQANMIQALTEGYRIAVGDNLDPQIAKDIIALRFIDMLETLLARQSSDDEQTDLMTLLRLPRGES